MARQRRVPPRHGHGNTIFDEKILVSEGVCVQGGFRDTSARFPIVFTREV